jgi:glycosyltransferase involved in cell wall biosynthesis
MKSADTRTDVREDGRIRISFFPYNDVFEDFYPHYGVGQSEFANRWADTGNHRWLSLLQREVGDVTWYELSLAPEVDETRHEVVGCRVKMLPSSWLHRRLWRLFYLSRWSWRWQGAYRAYAALASYLCLASWRVLREMWRQRPDFIFSQDYATGRFDVLILIAKLFGIPLLAYHAGSTQAGYIGAWARKWTLRQAAMLIVSSQAEREMLVQRFGVSLWRTTVVLSPIDTESLSPMDRDLACRTAGLSPDRRYLLFVGRLHPVKQVDKLINAFLTNAERHPDVDLLIVGDGPLRTQLEALVPTAFEDRVRFLGWHSETVMKRALYSVAECLALVSRSEGFPTVVGESMACGTPVIATRVGGVDELVREGETGWILDGQQLSQLPVVLGRILSSPDRIAAMRPKVQQAAKRRVSPAVVAAELRKCFFGISKPATTPDG